MSDKTSLSGWDKLGNLVYFAVKWIIILYVAYYLLIGLAIGWMISVARSPEGQKQIEENPYNNPPATDGVAPAKPASNQDFSPSGGSDYSGKCDPNDPNDPRCLPKM